MFSSIGFGKEAVFSLKLIGNNIEKVYIEFERISDQAYVQFEMKKKFQINNTFQYEHRIQLESQTIYKYRYWISTKDGTESEENFRSFKKNQEEDNYIDEWNKVWCVYQIRWNTQEYFNEFQSLKVTDTQRLFTTRKLDTLMYQCKILFPINQNLLSQQFQTFVFENTSKKDQQTKDEIYTYQHQEIYLNYVFTEYTFGLLGKVLANIIGGKLNDQLSLAQQTIKEESLQALKQEINQLRQELLNEDNKFQAEMTQFQDYSKCKINEYIEQINRFQQEIQEYKQKEISHQLEQMKLEKLEIQMQVFDEEQSKNQTELINSLLKYQDSVNYLETLKNEDNKIIGQKKQQSEFLKRKNDKLIEQLEVCKSNILAVEQKVQQCEMENQIIKKQQEKSQQTIRLLKIQIQTQKKELEQYKQALQEVKLKLEESEQQQALLQKDIENQQKKFQEQEKRMIDQIQANQNKQKQFAEEAQRRWELQKKQYFADFEGQKNEIHTKLKQSFQQSLEEITKNEISQQMRQNQQRFSEEKQELKQEYERKIQQIQHQHSQEIVKINIDIEQRDEVIKNLNDQLIDLKRKYKEEAGQKITDERKLKQKYEEQIRKIQNQSLIYPTKNVSTQTEQYPQ